MRAIEYISERAIVRVIETVVDFKQQIAFEKLTCIDGLSADAIAFCWSSVYVSRNSSGFVPRVIILSQASLLVCNKKFKKCYFENVHV